MPAIKVRFWLESPIRTVLASVGLADTNDPAMFVGAEEGKVTVAVPLDDNVAPARYLPLAERLLRRLPGTPRST